MNPISSLICVFGITTVPPAAPTFESAFPDRDYRSDKFCTVHNGTWPLLWTSAPILSVLIRRRENTISMPHHIFVVPWDPKNGFINFWLLKYQLLIFRNQFNTFSWSVILFVLCSKFQIRRMEQNQDRLPNFLMKDHNAFVIIQQNSGMGKDWFPFLP